MDYARFRFNHWIPKVIGAEAITLYPYVFCRSSEEESIKYNVVQHEMVHVEQVRKLGRFRFYWEYLKEYFRLRLVGHSHDIAYISSRFEQEAYSRQGDPKLLELYAYERGRETGLYP